MKRINLALSLFLVIQTSILFSQNIPCPWDWNIVSDFGPRLLNNRWDFHEGVDYSAAPGDDDLGTEIPASRRREHIKN